jgi:small-conductance mechanosensitive channel
MNGNLSKDGRSTAIRSRRLRRRRRAGVRRRPGDPLAGARGRLRHFRQATLLAIAITSLLLLLIAPWETGLADVTEGPAAVAAAPTPDDRAVPAAPVEGQENAETGTPEPLGQAAAEEAVRTVETLWQGFYGNLPKFLVVLVVIAFAWLLVRLMRPLLQRTLGRWERANALVALFGIAVWLLAAGISLSVLAGDIRALVGSLGLIGLALSWALQTPIESFSGWLLNSFQGYYRVGDRVAVGDVFGDVYQIDFLTTTVWEIGSPGRGGFVQAEQPTGRLITFPNNEVLAGTVVNLTRDFPYVWDELTVPLANESDLGHGMRVLAVVAGDLLQPHMAEPARRYAEILQRAGLETVVAEEPQVFISMNDSWTDLIIRYLVNARERRKWKSELTMRVMDELKKPEHAGRLIGVYPRRQVQFVGPDGQPADIARSGEGNT